MEEMGPPSGLDMLKGSGCNDLMCIRVPLSRGDEITYPRVFSNLLKGGNHSIFVPSAAFPNPEFIFSTNIGYPLCCEDCSRLWGYCDEWKRQILTPKKLKFQ